MAKKRNPNQATFFKAEIPEMPEGYYSSGPNPTLRRFVEEHAILYDPETDDYNVPPFDKPIKTTKATAIYNMHTYWSKKPHDAIREFIKHYTKPGDIVLDPMCGSGGTALAALMQGRTVIAIDLSPAATFITKNYCTPVEIEVVRRQYLELKGKINRELKWLYETRCDRCDGKAATLYTVYSYVYECSRCLEKVPLFDCINTQGYSSSGKPKKIKACPICYENGQIEEISTRSKRLKPVPVLVGYTCIDGCSPARDERRYDDINPKKRTFFEKFDIEKIREIKEGKIPYWYPTSRMLDSPPDEKRWGLLWRPYLHGIDHVCDFYTKRNLWALSLIRDFIDVEKLDVLSFAFTSLVLNASKMQQVRFTEDGEIRQGAADFAKGTYYVPSIFKEINCGISFERRFENVLKGLSSIKWESTDIIISTQNCTDISEIDTNTIDYIFTDPPYSWKVQYGEVNYIWEAWLGFNTKWRDDEIIINEYRDKSEIEWSSLIRQAMAECFRVLKPGRWISLCYHDTSEGTWMMIQDIMAEIGFITEKSEKTLYIDTDQKSWKQIVSEKITKRDLVINFRKPHPGELTRQLTLFGDEDPSTFVQKAQAIITEALENHPGSTADRLYDELVSRMVRKGEYERHNFDEILRSVAEEVSDPKVGGRWYLLETADQVDEAESRKETEVAKLLETFMQQYLQENPDELGVHYGDLFEQYLPIQDKTRRLMQEWLPEFFFKTEEGTWRPPADEEERAQKETLRTSGTLRLIKRFANALLEGVPPHERDIPPNTATAADWIRQCRRAGLYKQGRALYEKGGFTFDNLGEEAQMEVEEDYQICVRRSG